MTTTDRIFQIIKENNLTAKEFANIVGLSQGNITDWKTGRAKPSTDALIKISNAYNVSIDYLLCKSNLKVPLSKYTHAIFLNIKQYVISKYYNDIKKLQLTDYQLNKFLNCFEDLYVFGYDFTMRAYIDFLDSIKDISVRNNIEKLYEKILNNINNLLVYSDKYTPLAKNKDGKILNYISSSEINSNLEKILDKQDLIAIDNIMQKVNSSYIDGPIYSNVNNNQQNDCITNNLDSSCNFYMCPVYGQISAGQPNWAEECIEGRIPIDPVLFDIVNPEEHFFLRVNGESMNKVVRNGAYALIHKQDSVENGEIAVVLVNGYDATLKKFTKHEDVVVLEPISNDNSFQTQIYGKDTNIKILGKYIGKFEMNK